MAQGDAEPGTLRRGPGEPVDLACYDSSCTLSDFL